MFRCHEGLSGGEKEKSKKGAALQCSAGHGTWSEWRGTPSHRLGERRFDCNAQILRV